MHTLSINEIKKFDFEFFYKKSKNVARDIRIAMIYADGGSGLVLKYFPGLNLSRNRIRQIFLSYMRRILIQIHPKFRRSDELKKAFPIYYTRDVALLLLIRYRECYEKKYPPLLISWRNLKEKYGVE